MSMPRRGINLLVAALCTVVALTAGSAPAYAEPGKPGPSTTSPADPVPAGYRSWSQFNAVQDRLRKAAQRLNDGTEREAGFTGIEAVPENRRLRLYWKGQVPAPVAQLVAKVNADVPVDLLPARHSLAELLKQQAAITRAKGVTAIVPQVDGSGLTVRYVGSREQALGLPAIREATVPITIEPFDTSRFTSCTGRQDDCSPYWGGAKYLALGAEWCSTGFALKFRDRFGSTWTRMLSASHCGYDGALVYDGGSDLFGTVTGDDPGDDLMLIDPAGSNTVNGHIYVGPPTPPSFTGKPVAGTGQNIVGLSVCTSGAVTGEHCHLKIFSVNGVFNPSGSPAWVHTVEAQAPNNGVAMGLGDSGGPVFTSTLDGSKVVAQGTISGGKNPVPCPLGSQSSTCFNIVDYVDIQVALDHYSIPSILNVSVLTG